MSEIKRTFDRKPQFDERSRNYPAIVLGLDALPFRNYTWPLKEWLDQGSEGACVGFGISHELACVPAVIPVTNESARVLYKRAQQLDEWEGDSYEGTSVIAGMKAVQELKNDKGELLIPEYRWTFGLEELIRVLGRKGPMVIGCNWYTGMFDTDEKGFIHKTGELAGGHCVLGRGQSIKYLTPGDKVSFSNVDLDKSYITIHNSWGKSWGIEGKAKISLRDVQALLAEWGEAVLPIGRKNYIAE